MEMHMHVLQIGAAKSGNFWLYNILEQIFDRAGMPRKSFVRSRPIYSVAKDWPLSYPEQVDIDMLDIQNNQCYWRISTIFRMPVTDIETYVSKTDHVWTHSRICEKSFEVYPLFDKRVYTIRDPRDRAVSEAKFAFSDYMQRFSPCEESGFGEYLDNNLEAMMNRWRWHVYDHLKYAEDLNIHIVFYERLLHDFHNELERLLEYLQVNLSDKEQQAIARKVSFSTMKENSPAHLRKGKAGGWKTHLSDAQKRRSRAIVDPLITYLGYDGGLPAIPDHLDKQFLTNNLPEVGGRRLHADI